MFDEYQDNKQGENPLTDPEYKGEPVD